LGFRFDFDQKKKDLQSAIDASLQEADGLMDGWVERSFFLDSTRVFIVE